MAIRNENHEANKQVELEDVQFLPQGVDDQNSLPRNVDEPRDVEQFKAELDEAWKDIRFLHTVPQPSDTSHK